MFDFHEKRKIRRVVYSKVFIGGIFLLTLIIGKSVYERFTIEREMAEKLNERSEELITLEKRAALLDSKVEHLKNERGIEEELRTRFDVAKEGEQVVIIIDEKNTEKRSDSLQQSKDQNEDTGWSFLEMLKFW
jgi:cell division protein FtsB